MKCTKCGIKIKHKVYWHTRLMCLRCYDRYKEDQRLNGGNKK